MPRRTPASTPGPPPRPEPAVTIQKPDAEVWRIAYELADGDVDLLEVQDGGQAVKVWNTP